MFRKHRSRLEKPYLRLIPALSLFVVFVLATLLTNGFSSNSSLVKSINYTFKLASTHQPERYTVLYFDNHRTLSYDAVDGTVQINQFHITNYEAETYTYSYIAESTYLNKTLILSQGKVTLDPNQGTDISFSFIASYPVSNVLISVNLVGLPNHIFYWIQP